MQVMFDISNQMLIMNDNNVSSFCYCLENMDLIEKLCIACGTDYTRPAKVIDSTCFSYKCINILCILALIFYFINKLELNRPLALSLFVPLQSDLRAILWHQPK